MRTSPLVGRIVEWNRERGFGYMESDGRRVFLHVREFAERHKLPEVGDRVRFLMGVDRQGRPCAQQAVHVNDGGSFGRGHALVLLLLVVVPATALWRAAGGALFCFFAACWLAFSGLTYLAYSWDKQNARAKGRREPEKTLHLLELIGGWPGALVAQFRLRHKSSKLKFQVIFWLIVGLYQFLTIDYLLGWPMLRFVSGEIRKLMQR